MYKKILWSCMPILFVLYCSGCERTTQSPVDYEYPTKDPICLIEKDPELTVFDWTSRGRKFQPLPVGKVLVVPLYRNYTYQGGKDNLAIAHAFLYTQCDDIEIILAKYGQRDKLARLIIWAHGFLPTGMPHLASLSPTLDGKRVDILVLFPVQQFRDEGSGGAARLAAKTTPVGLRNASPVVSPR